MEYGILRLLQDNHYTVIEINSICGVYNQLKSNKNITLVFVEIIEDADEDGVIDELDYCKNGDSNWVSNINTDYDQDGCKDITEDIDDDNDGIEDYLDSCMSSLGWISDTLSDYDSDGCNDTYDDDDDDNDGIDDAEDFVQQEQWVGTQISTTTGIKMVVEILMKIVMTIMMTMRTLQMIVHTESLCGLLRIQPISIWMAAMTN